MGPSGSTPSTYRKPSGRGVGERLLVEPPVLYLGLGLAGGRHVPHETRLQVGAHMVVLLPPYQVDLLPGVRIQIIQVMLHVAVACRHPPPAL